jgi:hypothetical protein
MFQHSGAMKMNTPTSRHSQAELEEQLSAYFINARDRKGGRRERERRKQQRQQLDLSTEPAGST